MKPKFNPSFRPAFLAVVVIGLCGGLASTAKAGTCYRGADGYFGAGFTTVNATGLVAGHTTTFDKTNGSYTVVPEPRISVARSVRAAAPETVVFDSREEFSISNFQAVPLRIQCFDSSAIFHNTLPLVGGGPPGGVWLLGFRTLPKFSET